MKLAREPRMFDLEASVLDHNQTGVNGPTSRLVVAQTELEPNDFGSNLDRFVDHTGQCVVAPEDINDVRYFG